MARRLRKYGSDYYRWLKRKPRANQLRNEKMISWIKKLYEEQNGILGYRQMTITINRLHNVCYNRKRIRRLMQILGLKSEMYYLKRFADRDALILAIENDIHFCNTGRFRKRLRCMTPMEFHYAYVA